MEVNYTISAVLWFRHKPKYMSNTSSCYYVKLMFSHWPLQKHKAVHCNSALEHEHLSLHPFFHLKLMSSLQLTVTSGNVDQMDSQEPSVNRHPPFSRTWKLLHPICNLPPAVSTLVSSSFVVLLKCSLCWWNVVKFSTFLGKKQLSCIIHACFQACSVIQKKTVNCSKISKLSADTVLGLLLCSTNAFVTSRYIFQVIQAVFFPLPPNPVNVWRYGRHFAISFPILGVIAWAELKWKFVPVPNATRN